MEERKGIVTMNRRQFLKGTIAASAVLTTASLGITSDVIAAMEEEIKLPQLPYMDDALEPYISKNTMSFHYGKHHAGYVSNLIGVTQAP